MKANNSATQPTKPSPNPITTVDVTAKSTTAHNQGEGSYSGTRDYQAGVKSYLESANVEQDARDAAPDSADEARELEQAEAAGRNGRVKPEGTTKGE